MLGFWLGFWTRTSEPCYSYAPFATLPSCQIHPFQSLVPGLGGYHCVGRLECLIILGAYTLEPVVQLMPGVLLAIGSFILPPSPRYLVAHERSEEAESILIKLRKASDGLEDLVQVCDRHITRAPHVLKQTTIQ